MHAKQFPRQRRWWLLMLAFAAGLAVIAAACSDDDFDDAPADRGAAAAATVGAEFPAEQEAADQSAQAADQAAEPDQAAEEVSADQATAAQSAGDADLGQELFFANGCNVCHGEAGEGGIGSTIAQTGLTLDQVIAQYRTPRGFMPPFLESQVTDAEVAEIFAWLQTQPLPDTIVPGEGTP